jgi:elongation factor G
MTADNIRNVAIVGPSGSGKTTLLESLLFVSGAIGRKGRVADRNTVGDASQEARERQISTEVNAATAVHSGIRFNFLDTPGAVDFLQEMRHAVVGADLAVVVVEPVLERMITLAPFFQFLDAHAIPHLVFINKMDRSEVRYRDLLDALRKLSSRPVIPHQYAIGRGSELVGYIDLVTEQAYAFRDGQPAGQIPLPEEYREREQQARTEMLETLADFDDELMEKLLEDQQPTPEQIIADLRKTLTADQVVPVFLGVAEQDKGVRRLLEAIVKEAPDPLMREQALGVPPIRMPERIMPSSIRPLQTRTSDSLPACGK